MVACKSGGRTLVNLSNAIAAYLNVWKVSNSWTIDDLAAHFERLPR
jgi:hypothetical protein